LCALFQAAPVRAARRVASLCQLMSPEMAKVVLWLDLWIGGGGGEQIH